MLESSLHGVGYSGALGSPLFPTKEALGNPLFPTKKFLLSASGVNHQHLLDIAASLLSDLPKGSPVHKPKTAYARGDFRHKTNSEVIDMFSVVCYFHRKIA